MSFIKIIFVCLSSLFLASCSVIMAAQKDGVSPKDLSSCKTRSCIIASGGEPLDSIKNSKQILVSEHFRALMPKGSAARAAMHGVLDVATFGIWEVAGTPIEAVKKKSTHYVVAVTYENDGQTVKKINFEF